MSKEQTLTAEEYIKSQDSFLGKGWRDDDKELIDAFKEFSNHNTKIAVLEALERAKEYCDEFAIKKIETEVKPKYEKV